MELVQTQRSLQSPQNPPNPTNLSNLTHDHNTNPSPVPNSNAIVPNSNAIYIFCCFVSMLGMLGGLSLFVLGFTFMMSDQFDPMCVVQIIIGILLIIQSVIIDNRWVLRERNWCIQSCLIITLIFGILIITVGIEFLMYAQLGDLGKKYDPQTKTKLKNIVTGVSLVAICVGVTMMVGVIKYGKSVVRANNPARN